MEIDAGQPQLPHARDRLPEWVERWRESSRLILLLDFDGTLAPIVERPEAAGMPASTRRVLEQLIGHPGVEAAIISGRGMADARDLAALDGIAYAGNHGMEIEGPELRRIHPEAEAARPQLEEVIRRIEPDLAAISGAFVEDKGLTLSIHYRLVDRAQVDRVRHIVRSNIGEGAALTVTQGKEVLEVRPRVDWDKGRAVGFLLASMHPPAGAPILYIGDDTTDEDAFRAVRRWPGGEGVVVGDPPPPNTAAIASVRDPAEVADILELLLRHAPPPPDR